MSTSWPLTVEIDVAEPRVLKDRLIFAAGGLPGPVGWDRALLQSSPGCWIDPVTNTLMLAPLPTTAAWFTTTTGSYARLRKSAYTLTTAAAWVENERAIAGNYYLEGNGTNELVRTTATYPVNQPMFISLWVPGVEGLHEQTILECGWGVPAASGTVSLRVRANGSISVYKGTTCVGHYDSQFAQNAGKRSSSKAAALSTISLMLIPCRRTELLVVTDAGEGVSHVFTDLDPESTSNTITPSGYFWWQVPTGKPSVQCAPLKFATAGTAYGPLQTARYAPPTGAAFGPIEAVDRIGPTAGTIARTVDLVKPDLTTFTPNGTLTQARVRVQLTGDGTATTGVYAMDLVYPGTVTTTADDPTDITEYLSRLELRVDEKGDTYGTLETKRIADMIAGGVPQIGSPADRPCRVALGAVDILRGTLCVPQIVPAEGRANGIADVLTLQVRSRELDFTDYTFADTYAYDGLLLTDVIADLVKTCGYADADLVITANTFRLPYTPAVSMGEWEIMPKRGDTVGGMIGSIYDAFAATWIRGWTPTLAGYRYTFRDPSTYSLTPVEELFQSFDDAAAFGVIPALRSSRTIRRIMRVPIEPEANQIIVVGRNKRTEQPVIATYNDAASQDPTTVPSARPTNWRGKVIRYQLIDPAITSQAAADRARDILADRLTVVRDLWEIETDILVRATDNRPLWIGDTVRIYKAGSHTAHEGDFQIISIPKMVFVYEDIGGTRRDHRTGVYRLKRVGAAGGS